MFNSIFAPEAELTTKEADALRGLSKLGATNRIASCVGNNLVMPPNLVPVIFTPADFIASWVYGSEAFISAGPIALADGGTGGAPTFAFHTHANIVNERPGRLFCGIYFRIDFNGPDNSPTTLFDISGVTVRGKAYTQQLEVKAADRSKTVEGVLVPHDTVNNVAVFSPLSVGLRTKPQSAAMRNLEGAVPGLYGDFNTVDALTVAVASGHSNKTIHVQLMNADFPATANALADLAKAVAQQ